ncbi:MAG: hypothetical protein ACON38_15975 [Akkermansiaceae bacterium]|jgi:hypothetical protein
MKAYISIIALTLAIAPLHAQTTPGTPGRTGNTTNPNDNRTDAEKEEIEGLKDDENRKGRWEASLPGGEYSVKLGAITSISKHSYVLDATLLVTEVAVDTTGNALARFYYIEPITKDTEFNALARFHKRAEELRNRTQKRMGTQADEMAQKNYPMTTHARTIEFRIMHEGTLNALYSSLYRAWDSGKGRTFRIQ